jgi:hypothetical protein
MSRNAGEIARRDDADGDAVAQREQGGDTALDPIDGERAALVRRQPQLAGLEFRMVERKVAANGIGVVDAGISQPADEPDDQDDQGNSADRQDQVQRAHDSGTS